MGTSYMKKVLISRRSRVLTPNKVVENCSCIFYIPTFRGGNFTFFHYAIQINDWHIFSRPTD